MRWLKHAGIAHTAGVIQWMDTGCLGRTGWESDEGVWGMLHFLWKVCIRICQESVENLWVKISGKSNIGSVLESMCYRPSDKEELDEAFFKQQKDSHLQTLILMGKFNHPDNCWKDNASGYKNLAVFYNNFLTQVIQKTKVKGCFSGSDPYK